jgi:glucokinase
VVDPNGPRCLCGKQGCLERLASGRYMAQDAREMLREQTQKGSILRQLVDGQLEAISGQILSQAAEQGDALAWEILHRSAWALGTAIGNAANLINPQLFVLGGGVTKAGERYWNVVRNTARQTVLPEVHFEIQPAALGDDAPLWGAAALAEDLCGELHQSMTEQKND